MAKCLVILTDRQRDWMRDEAARRGISCSAVLRDLLDEQMGPPSVWDGPGWYVLVKYNCTSHGLAAMTLTYDELTEIPEDPDIHLVSGPYTNQEQALANLKTCENFAMNNACEDHNDSIQ